MSRSAMSSDESRVTGRVKWFNNKRGFGFITSLTGDTVGVDVFVHHSAITTSNEQFLYLVQGEYVDFVMKPATSEESAQAAATENEPTPRWEAAAVTGFGGGKLMCETRHETRADRRSHYAEQSSSAQATPAESASPSHPRAPAYRGRGRGGRSGRGRGSHSAQQDQVFVYVNQPPYGYQGRPAAHGPRSDRPRVSHDSYY